jgi:hypothetical protein
MGQLLVPAMIGAGVGAAGGALTGQNPFKAALLGAGLGAGGAGLMGAGGAGGAGAAAGTAGTGAGAGLIGGANLSTAGGLGLSSSAAGATGGLGNFLSSIRGIETTPVSMGTGGYASGIGGQAIGGSNAMLANLGPGQSLDEILNLNIPKQNLADITSPEAVVNSTFPKFESSGLFEPSSFRNLDTGTSVGAPFSTEAFTNNPLMAQQIINNAGQTASTSFLDNIGNMIGNPFTDLTPRDKLGLGLQGASMLNQPPQQMQTPPLMPITRGNPEMVSSPLFNVAPNVGMQEGNDIGLPNLETNIPLTDEEILRLQQMLQTTGFRGR